jgi:N-acyl-D-amino-acid deacylase
MAHDLIVRNVEIMDGTGADAFRGDVAVADGRISEVGTVTAGLASDGVEVDGDGATCAQA